MWMIIFGFLVQEGAVYMFKGGENFPYHNVTDECPAVDITPCPERHASLIFKSHEEKSRFGFDFAFVSSKFKVTFIKLLKFILNINKFRVIIFKKE